MTPSSSSAMRLCGVSGTCRSREGDEVSEDVVVWNHEALPEHRNAMGERNGPEVGEISAHPACMVAGAFGRSRRVTIATLDGGTAVMNIDQLKAQPTLDAAEMAELFGSSKWFIYQHPDEFPVAPIRSVDCSGGPPGRS